MSLALSMTLDHPLDPNDTEAMTLHVENTQSPPYPDPVKYCKVCIKNITPNTGTVGIASTIPASIPDVCLNNTQLDDINNGLKIDIPLGAIKSGSVNPDGTLNDASDGDIPLNVTIESSICDCKDQPNSNVNLGGIAVTLHP